MREHAAQLIVMLGELRQLVGQHHDAGGEGKGIGAQTTAGPQLETVAGAVGGGPRGDLAKNLAQLRLARRGQRGRLEGALVEHPQTVRADDAVHAGRNEIDRARGECRRSVADESDGREQRGQQGQQRVAPAALEFAQRRLGARQPCVFECCVELRVVEHLDRGAVRKLDVTMRVSDTLAERAAGERHAQLALRQPDGQLRREARTAHGE